MIINRDNLQEWIKTLRAIKHDLSPKSEVSQSMLSDALKGEFSRGLHGDWQRQLLVMHEARQHIEQAIANLERL